MAGWIENHFSEQIGQAAQTVTGVRPRITFTIDPELSGHQRRPNPDGPAKESVETGVPQKAAAAKSANARKRQLKLRLDSFIVGPSNELAYTAAKAVVGDTKSPYNPLFIHGGYGVGKTHLLQGICNAVRESRPQTNWLYISAEDFANQFVLALKTRKLEAFRRRMRQTELLAIDDIHFLAGKPSTQEEFLHTFNSIDMAGKQVVLASDAHPKMIGQLSEKLVNRFVSGMVVKIDLPDRQTRVAICRQYAKNAGITLPEAVLKYITENIKTNVRELEGALVKLIAFASLQNARINLDLAREVLTEHLARTDPIVHICDIESSVAAYFGITIANLHSSKKNKVIAMARHFGMYLARKLTKMSSLEVGRLMGKKNHATVLFACKKVEDLIKRDAQVYWNSPEGNRAVKARNILDMLEKDILA